MSKQQLTAEYVSLLSARGVRETEIAAEEAACRELSMWQLLHFVRYERERHGTCATREKMRNTDATPERSKPLYDRCHFCRRQTAGILDYVKHQYHFVMAMCPKCVNRMLHTETVLCGAEEESQ